MPFLFTKTDIPDVLVVEPKVFPDARGFFVELYKASDFKKAGLDVSFVQVNQSRSQKNVLRGLHYQLNPKAQAKLVSVVRGEIFDVAVDIRKGSPTFGKWVGERLSETNKRMLYIPTGFAHGFCALSDEVELMYYCSCEYAAECERSIVWNDPTIHVAWPIMDTILSPKDSGGKMLSQADNNFVFSAC
ncbi:MAG: dTDP-4-dehydrorhamnose 3,5-epimerase [Candidatus Omnitrophica bacterium]|nr:dTDP-4-dehydrorhamnose 3,5-epimerase [Candidatus Omnitrophota bacterium]